MPESLVPRTKHDIVTVISDSGASNSYTVAYEPGDFAWDTPGYAVVPILDNGVPTNPRRGDGAVATFSWSVHLRDHGSTAHATLPDICQNTNYVASNWTSTLNQATDLFTWDVAHTVDGDAFGESDRTLTFPNAILRGGGATGLPSSYSVTGECATALAPTLS